MANKAANKIKQRKERLKETQTPVVVSKPNKWWFWILAAISVSVIVYLSYLAYTSDFTNELVIPITAVIVLLWLIIWYLPKFYVRSLPIEMGKDFDREKERLKLEDDTRKTFAQIIGGIVLLGGLIFTYNTYRIQTEQTRLQVKQQEINQEGQFTDRFTKAVDQLGDEKLEIRLGGLYALERIAKDSPKDYWTVIEILSAYIRENAKKKESVERNENKNSANDKVDKAEKNTKVTTDTQAALTIIGRRKSEQDPKADRIDLSGTDLSGAVLMHADLSGADLSEADLLDANLIGADLSGAILWRADLSRAVLSGVNLSNANLLGADLGEVKNLTFGQLNWAFIDKNTKLPNDLEKQKAELLELSKKRLEEREKRLNEIKKERERLSENNQK